MTSTVSRLSSPRWRRLPHFRGILDIETAPAKFSVVQRGNCLVGAAPHFHESKPTQTTRIPVLNQTDVFNDAIGAKELSNLFRRHIDWEMVNINVGRHTNFLSQFLAPEGHPENRTICISTPSDDRGGSPIRLGCGACSTRRVRSRMALAHDLSRGRGAASVEVEPPPHPSTTQPPHRTF